MGDYDGLARGVVLMALDKFVDSAQLDSDLEDVADAIRAKTGGSSQLAFPNGFVSEIESISSGVASYGITEISCAYTAQNNNTVKAILPSLNTLTLVKSSSAYSVDIDTLGKAVVHSTTASSSSKCPVKKIDLHGANLQIGASASSYGLRYNNQLTEVNAKCVTPITSVSNQFTGASALTTIYWQENAQVVSLNISACPLNQDSLVSIANGLKEGSSLTLTLSSARKTMCDSIMGTVEEVLDEEQQVDHHKFVVDANGTTTLTSFITTTKGWTLA